MNLPKVFIDSDIILDVVFTREPHYKASTALLSKVENHEIEGFTSALVLANCYYIIEKQINANNAAKIISKIRAILTTLAVTDKEIAESLSSGFADFEDGVQYYVCLNNGINKLITRNIKDFSKAKIGILTPAMYLKL